MDKTEFTFVFPNVLNGRLFEGFDYHLGAGYIRAYLATHGIKSTQYLARASRPVSEIAADIAGGQPGLIGFSVYDANYHIVKILANEIRKINPDVTIVFGGPTATFSDIRIMEDCPAVDICTRSYAEEIALDLVRWERGEIDLQNIGGITYRSRGTLFKNDDGPVPHRAPALSEQASLLKEDRIYSDGFRDSGGSLDIYPDPYMAGLIPPERVSDIGLVTSRGCTFACTFCNFSAMSGWSVSTHSLSYQMKVFRYLNAKLENQDRSKTLVTINDDNFSLQGKRFHQLLKYMSAEPFDSLTFWAEMRTEPLRDETFAMLKSARFSEINFGLESASPRVLAAMKKVRSSGWDRDGYAKETRFLERMVWAVQQAKREGIATTVSIILGGPLETFDEGLLTLEFIKNLDVDAYAHNFLVIGDGTALAEDYHQFGLENENPAARILPPITRVPYDVYQLPILEHDRSWLPMTGFEMRQVGVLFSGNGHLQTRARKPRGNGRGGAGRIADENGHDQRGPVIAIEDASSASSVSGWLARTMPINSSIWLIHSHAFEKVEAQNAMYSAGVLTPELNTLRKTENAEGAILFRMNEFSETAPDQNTRIVGFMPFLQFDEVHSREAKNVRMSVIYTINKQTDFNGLARLAAPAAEQAHWKLPGDFVAERTVFQDSCRWCSGKCPATQANRLFVGSDMTVRPCSNGAALGHVGDTVDEIKRRAVEAAAKIEEERNCKTCPVNASCAKCLFTAPFTVTEYCEQKRATKNATSLFDSTVALRALFDSGEISPDQGPFRITSLQALGNLRLEGDGEEIEASQCILIRTESGIGGFIYSHQDDFLATCTEEGASVIATLAMCDEKKMVHA